MSSVTYNKDGEIKDPKTLFGYKANAKYLSERVQKGDMLFNNKTGEVIIMVEHSGYYYYVSLQTHELAWNASSVTKQTRAQAKERISQLKDFEYIPIENIKNMNFDIEMK